MSCSATQSRRGCHLPRRRRGRGDHAQSHFPPAGSGGHVRRNPHRHRDDDFRHPHLGHRTWRSRIYPEGQQSLSAAGFVWSKAPNLIRLYDDGAIIRSKQGLYFAIPTPAAGRFGDRRQKITPLLWERIHGMRLRFVYRQPGPSLLVADNVRLTARGRAAANIGRCQGASYSRLSGRTTAPLFLLVPQVSVKKRLDVEGAAQKWIGALPELVLGNWHNHA